MAYARGENIIRIGCAAFAASHSYIALNSFLQNQKLKSGLSEELLWFVRFFPPLWLRRSAFGWRLFRQRGHKRFPKRRSQVCIGGMSARCAEGARMGSPAAQA